MKITLEPVTLTAIQREFPAAGWINDSASVADWVNATILQHLSRAREARRIIEENTPVVLSTD